MCGSKPSGGPNICIDKRNNFTYECTDDDKKVQTTFGTYDAATLTDSQKATAKDLWGNKKEAYYACVQGCGDPYKCIKTTTQSQLAYKL